MATMTRVAGYEVVRDVPVRRIEGRLTELVHGNSGLRHIHIAYPEERSSCYIVARTRSEDDTGVPHVLEHMTFAGSRRFNHAMMRDHSTKLLGGRSASTSQDYTQYNFRSQHPDGWFGMLAVAFDGVFFPTLDEESFLAEAWRYEFTTPDDPSSDLIITGRVYNEMKGTSVNDFYNLWAGAGAALYPDTVYAHNAGADLEAIQSLTWDATRAYHSRYYHPSNVVIITAGTVPLQRVLETIETTGVNEVPRRDAEPNVPARHLPASVRHDIPKASDDLRSAQGAVAWATSAPRSDAFAFRSVALLTEALLGIADAPLRKAFSDAGLGGAACDAPRLLDTLPHTGVLAGVKGVSAEEAARVESLALEALQQLARGIPQEHLDRALDAMEVDLHDRGEANYLGLVDWPFSLRLCMPAFQAAINGADVLTAIDWGDDLDELRRRAAQGGYFEELIRTELIDNPHRALVRLVPEPGRAQRLAEVERKRFLDIRESLGDEGRQAIVERSARLNAREHAPQEELPLPAADPRAVQSQVVPSPIASDAVGAATLTLYPFEGTGLLHADVRFDATGIDASDCDLLPLLARLLSRTGGHGLEASTTVAQRSDGGPVVWLTLGGKTLTRHAADFIAAMQRALTESSYDPALIAAVIAELRGEAEKDLVYTWSAPKLAQSLAAAGLDDGGAIAERLLGTTRLATLRELDPEAVAARLRMLSTELVSQGRAHAFAAVHRSVVEEVQTQLDSLLSGLAGRSQPSPLPAGLAASFPAPGEARTTSATQAFNALVYRTVPFTHTDSPVLSVLGIAMMYRPELQAISKERGAYGALALEDSSHGHFAFTSWYDPHIALTMDTFDAVARSFAETPLRDDEVRGVAGLVYAGAEPHLASDALVRRDWDDRLLGISREAREARRQAILAVTGDDLARVASTFLCEPRRATLGDAALIDQAQRSRPGLFARIRPA